CAPARGLVASREFAVVPGDDVLRAHADAGALARRGGDPRHGSVLGPAGDPAVSLRHGHQDVAHELGVAHQLGLAVVDHAHQLGVGHAGLDQQRDAGIALQVLDLLALGEGRHHHGAVGLEAEPHRHRVRRALTAVAAEDHGLRAVEEALDLVRSHLDLSAARHGRMIHSRAGGPMKLPFYFDSACPWAYLGSCRAEAYFAEAGAEIDFHPVYLAALREPGAGQLPEMGERKKRNYRNDLLHWAECCGAQLSPEAGKARPDTRLLLQCALGAGDLRRFREFHYPAYRARWAEPQDVADEGVLRGLLRGAGLDADAALARAKSP